MQDTPNRGSWYSGVFSSVQIFYSLLLLKEPGLLVFNHLDNFSLLELG